MIPLLDHHDTIAPQTCNLQLATAALPCDAHHHYYHYQASAQYLLLSRSLFALNLHKEAMTALQRAVFQDHFNEEALAMQAAGSAQDVALSYSKHPVSDAAFCRSIGKIPDEVSLLHDEAMQFYAKQDYVKAAKRFGGSPEHGNSRFGLAKCYFMQGRYEEARDHAGEAIRLSHADHDAYHRQASDAHLAQGKQFLAQGEVALAYNECIRALNLNRQNQEALTLSQQLQAQLKEI